MNEQTIGVVLAEARRAAGLTVGQLSAITKIREALLYAIERDDFSLCGGDFYTRGHVKAIAKAVGLDPEAMVHLYDEQHGGLPQPVRAATVFQSSKGVKLRERGRPNWTMALGVALAIVVVFGVVRVMGGAGQVPTAGITPVSSTGPTVPPNAPASPAEPRRTAAQSTQKDSDLVVVKAKAKRSSYINVRDSKGKKLFAGTLRAGKSDTWTARAGVNLLLRDAGAVSLQVNGKNLGTLGASGEQVRRTFGPETPPQR
ncbi:helix-turn-helix domain-containing protein [Nonomuraea africana]|uniref:Cytoskeletal protein RodZ n=1 Tax=Nonomuraea africana TaxID=46171 RepID=A0ABR9KKC8_9ACTN|nr:helix-turn-helix domain-containing protein [Nonomuraea africana]MBE1562473.1 cytoskeletal protein RodZ [Nonomuraea africana]